jgi:biotin carboxylase
VSLVAIFEEMADQIRAALPTTSWDFQVEPWAITSPTPPSIDMYRGQVTEDDAAAFGATVEDMGAAVVVVVRARVSTNDNEGNQDVLYALADPTDDHCLVQAIYDDATLNGWASDVHLLSDSGLTVVTSIDGATAHYGNVWRFLVIPAVS